MDSNELFLTADELRDGDTIIYCGTGDRYGGTSWPNVVVGQLFQGDLFSKEYIRKGWGKYGFKFTVIRKSGPELDPEGNPIYRYVKGKGWVYG